MRICFGISDDFKVSADNAKRMCIDIPEYYLPRKFPPDPEPDPRWIKGVNLAQEIIHDLPVLATLDKVASNLKDPQARKQFSDAMKGIVGGLNIPKEIQIELSQSDKVTASN